MKQIQRIPDSELEIMMIIWDASEKVTSDYIMERLDRDWVKSTVLNFLSRLCDRGFVIAASHRNQGQRELRAPSGGDRTQSEFCVADFDARQTSRSQTTMCNGGQCARRLSLRQQGVGIKIFAFERQKQIASFNAAGIGMQALQTQTAIAHQGACQASGLQPFINRLQMKHHALTPSPQTFCTSAWSEK